MVDKRRLPRSRQTCDADERSERQSKLDVFQVMPVRAGQSDRLSVPLPPDSRDLDAPFSCQILERQAASRVDAVRWSALDGCCSGRNSQIGRRSGRFRLDGRALFLPPLFCRQRGRLLDGWCGLGNRREIGCRRERRAVSMTVPVAQERRGNSLADDFSAKLAGARAEIDHIVCGLDHLLVMLDDDHGVAEVAQPLERADQLDVVMLVKADRRLVEHIQNAAEL
jgi:hypothetical protein